MLKLMDKKIFKFYAQIFCFSKPVLSLLACLLVSLPLSAKGLSVSRAFPGNNYLMFSSTLCILEQIFMA